MLLVSTENIKLTRWNLFYQNVLNETSICYLPVMVVKSLQEENFHWNLTFAMLQMENSLDKKV